MPIYQAHSLAGVPLSLFLSLFHLHSILKPSKYVNEVLRCIYTKHRFEFCLKSKKVLDQYLFQRNGKSFVKGSVAAWAVGGGTVNPMANRV